MRVYKFGGASIATPGRMEGLLPIVKDNSGPILTVLSALGKTTNALEQVVAAACSNNKEEARRLAKNITDNHLEYAHQLLDDTRYAAAVAALHPYIKELEKAIADAHHAHYDRGYDSIVCIGELLSTCIFSHYLQQQGIANTWIDIRTVLVTDHTYRDAAISWDQSRLHAEAIIGRALKQGKIIVTQGFIGATADGRPVTLGREGSDYTAAVLAAMLQLQSVTIWKDVDGLQNADPKLFPDTVKIPAITYSEVIEMAFYGAQIIHPKTIKPLQNAGIPLYVKCFSNPALAGSVVQSAVDNNTPYPPLIVLKDNQALVQVTTKDFSFITEDNLSRIYGIFHSLKVKINIIQNAAISFVAAVDNRNDKIAPLLQALGKDYDVRINEDVSLLTVRHYTTELIFGLTKDKQVLLRQETRKTVQVVMR